MKVVAQFTAVALVVAQAAAQFVPPGCTDIACTIYQVSICGDPHVKTLDSTYDVSGTCEDIALMNNPSFDAAGNDYLMTADVTMLFEGVSVVNSMMLKIGSDTLSVASSGSLLFGDAAGLSAMTAEQFTFGVNGDVEGIVESFSQSDSRALQSVSGEFGPNGFYIVVSVFIGDGTIIVISNKFGVLCITIVGPFSVLSTINGLLGYQEGDDGSIGDFITEGCSIAPKRLRSRALSAIGEESYNEVCSHMQGSDKSLCAFGLLMENGEIHQSM
jgi:hypothetical protein